jgi:hypothetical protein
MYALEMTAEQVEVHLDSLLLDSTDADLAARGNGKLAASNGKLAATNGTVVSNGTTRVPSDLALS